MITNSQKRALLILKETSITNRMMPREFALKMWPDSNMHNTTKNTGNGACRGKAAWLCGGSYIGKLAAKGWVTRGMEDCGAYLTSDGRKLANSL
jgi:hypothetical protein